MKSILIELNIADDYFKARARYEDIEENYKKAEKDLFDLKHELVDTQMKVEELLEKLDSERQEKTNKNAREQAVEEQYKKLEDKYQLLLTNAKISDEKNRQFEEILRLSEKEKRELESVNRELRLNKEKLESALADALFGVEEQAKKADTEPPQMEPASPIVELSEEEKQAIAELAKINEPVPLEDGDMEFAGFSEDNDRGAAESVRLSKDDNGEATESSKEDVSEMVKLSKEGVPETVKLSKEDEAAQLSEDDALETDPIFAEVSEEDDPELQELARQIAELDRQEQAEKNKK